MMLPAYEVFLAGMYQGSAVRYGTRLAARVPAKAVPGAVRALLELYRGRRTPGEPFPAFVDRLGKGPFEEALARFAAAPAFDPGTPGFYQDWERTGLYKVERGEGECAM
jgi:sulfite reductase beta subunit-like hemoprotein